MGHLKMGFYCILHDNLSCVFKRFLKRRELSIKRKLNCLIWHQIHSTSVNSTLQPFAFVTWYPKHVELVLDCNSDSDDYRLRFRLQTLLLTQEPFLSDCPVIRPPPREWSGPGPGSPAWTKSKSVIYDKTEKSFESLHNPHRPTGTPAENRPSCHFCREMKTILLIKSVH